MILRSAAPALRFGGVRIISVNIGRPRPNEWKEAPEFTAIDKRPVDGPVAVRAAGSKPSGQVGLEGDRVGDLEHHGGTEQAVYAFSREDYDHFGAIVGREFRDGMFGENLTVTGHDLSRARTGERWRGPDGLVLEVTSPRIPCNTFRGWVAEKGWLKTFTEEARPGAYLKVVSPGTVSKDMELEVIDRPDHDITIERMFKAGMGDRELAMELLESPHLGEDHRDHLLRRYDR